MEQPGPGTRAALHVLLARMEVCLGDLGRDLVERRKDVVGGEHDRLGRRLGMTAPCAQDLLPGDARSDSIGGQDRLHRLAAARLEDAELGHTAQFLRRGGSGLAGGGQEEVEAGLARLRDRIALRGDAGGVVPVDYGYDCSRHVPSEPSAAMLQLGQQGRWKLGGRFGLRGHPGDRFGHGLTIDAGPTLGLEVERAVCYLSSPPPKPPTQGGFARRPEYGGFGRPPIPS